VSWQMVTRQRRYQTPSQEECLKQSRRLRWDDKITQLQANRFAITIALFLESEQQ